MPDMALQGGFETPAQTAAHAFRAIMTAMASPGKINEINGTQPPLPISVAAGTVILTLCDPDSPLWLGPAFDTAEVRRWIAFHAGAPIASPEEAVFALSHWKDFPFDRFPVGTPSYPDRSTTLIVEVDRLAQEGATLTGPGIEATATLNLPELCFFRKNNALFPLGLDTLLTCGNRIAAIPRSTRVGGLG